MAAPCQHTFCDSCIQRTVSKNACPLCKCKMNKRSLRKDEGLHRIIGAYSEMRRVYENLYDISLSQSGHSQPIDEEALLCPQLFQETKENANANAIVDLLETPKRRAPLETVSNMSSSGKKRLQRKDNIHVSPSMSTQQIAEYILKKRKYERELKQIDEICPNETSQVVVPHVGRKSARFNNPEPREQPREQPRDHHSSRLTVIDEENMYRGNAEQGTATCTPYYDSHPTQDFSINTALARELSVPDSLAHYDEQPRTSKALTFCTTSFDDFSFVCFML